MAANIFAADDTFHLVAESPAFVLDTHSITAGALPQASRLVAESEPFPLDTRPITTDVTSQSTRLVAESDPFPLDTQPRAGEQSISTRLVAESPAFPLDTRPITTDATSQSTRLVAESDPFPLDTRPLLSGDSSGNFHLVSESPPFPLDTHAATELVASLRTVGESDPFSLDTRGTAATLVEQSRSVVESLPFALNTLPIAPVRVDSFPLTAVSDPFSLDTKSAYPTTPFRVLASATDGSANASVGALRFSPDGLRLAAAQGGLIRLWDLRSTRAPTTVGTSGAEITALDFAPTGDQLLAGSGEGLLLWFDPDTRLELGRKWAGNGAAHAVYAMDGARLLAGAGSSVAVWRRPGFDGLATLPSSEGAVTAVALSPDNKLALAGNSARGALLWNVETGILLARFTNHTHVVTAAAFSPSGDRALTASLDGTIRVWDMRTLGQVIVIQQVSPAVAASWSRDGRLIVSANNASPGLVFLWNVNDGSPRRIATDLSAEASRIEDVALSPDQTLLATSHSDGRVRLWDAGMEALPVDTPILLAPGQPETPLTLRSHARQYFRVEVPAGRSLVVRLEAATRSVQPQSLNRRASGRADEVRFGNLDPVAREGGIAPSAVTKVENLDVTALQLFVAKGRLPNVHDFDTVIQATMTNLRAEAPITSVTGGTYYVLALSPYLSDGSIQTRVSAAFDDFHLSSIEPNIAGNSGLFTARIAATGLQNSVALALVGASKNRLSATSLMVSSDTEAFATFDLRQVPVGTYSILMTRLSDGVSTMRADVLRIVPGSGGALRAEIRGPAAVRSGRTYTYSVEYENIGDADIPAPVLMVSSAPSVSLRNLDDISATSGLAWLASSPSFIGGVLPPGQRGALRFKASATATSQIQFGVVQDDEQPFDWDGVRKILKPEGASDSEWTRLIESARAKIGTSRSQVFRHLREMHRNNLGPLDIENALRMALFLVGQDIDIRPRATLQSLRQQASQNRYDAGSDVKVITENGKPFDPNKPAIIVTHGWNGNETTQRFVDLATDLAAKYPTYNVIRVTWKEGADHLLPWDASKNIPAVAEAALTKLSGLGYSRWGETVYVGESFGNGVNARISEIAPQKGLGLVFNGANPAGYPDATAPDYSTSFRRSYAIQTRDLADDNNPHAEWTLLLRDPDCGGRACNGWGESHTSGVRYLDRLLDINPNLADSLLNGRLELEKRGPGFFDGGVDWTGNLFTHPGGAPFGVETPFNAGSDVRPLGSVPIEVVRPIDPNEKLAPIGIGPTHAVAASETLDYTIRFENAPSHGASAPVQELVVVDYLDPNLDWTSVRFGILSYGDRIIAIPPEGITFSTRDVPPTNSVSIAGRTEGALAVDVAVSLNPQIGRVEWRARAVDTKTGFFPYDALAGFLPQTSEQGRNGYVTLSVKPKPGVADGTVITNIASIVFDANDPIRPPPVWNTIANVAVTALYPGGEISIGVPFTYALTVTNRSGALANGLTLTHSLPNGLTLVSSLPSAGILSTNNDSLLWNLGAFTNGAAATLNVTVAADRAGEFRSNASLSGGAGGTTFSLPIVLQVAEGARPALEVTTDGSLVQLSWPESAKGFVLEYASAVEGTPWTRVPETPTVTTGRFRINVRVLTDTRFFRLRRTQ